MKMKEILSFATKMEKENIMLSETSQIKKKDKYQIFPHIYGNQYINLVETWNKIVFSRDGKG